MTKQLMTALLMTVVFIVYAQEKSSLDNNANLDLLSSLKAYQEENLLQNGNFVENGFNTGIPMFWLADRLADEQNEFLNEAKEHTLQGGSFELRKQHGIWQGVDISSEVALEYILSFKALSANAGKLNVSLIYCPRKYTRLAGPSKIAPVKRNSLLSQVIKLDKEYKEYKFHVKLDPDTVSGFLEVNFKSPGNGSVEFRNVLLKPVQPKSKLAAKDIKLTMNQKNYCLKGLVIPPKHSFYERLAAKYLQKYLHVCFGRYFDIYMAEASVCKEREGLILIGDDFIDDSIKAEVRTGGYALVTVNGNLLVGGKEDGVIHGVLACLSSMGMEFYTPWDFTPATRNDLKIAKSKNVVNPGFGYRFWGGSGWKEIPLGFSCFKQWFVPKDIGFWSFNDHVLSLLVDPAGAIPKSRCPFTNF